MTESVDWTAAPLSAMYRAAHGAWYRDGPTGLEAWAAGRWSNVSRPQDVGALTRRPLDWTAAPDAATHCYKPYQSWYQKTSSVGSGWMWFNGLDWREVSGFNVPDGLVERPEIDWTAAPEGADYYQPIKGEDGGRWYRDGPTGLEILLLDGWENIPRPVDGFQLVQRPVTPPYSTGSVLDLSDAVDWDDLPANTDYYNPLTGIAYRDMGTHWSMYNPAIHDGWMAVAEENVPDRATLATPPVDIPDLVPIGAAPFVLCDDPAPEVVELRLSNITPQEAHDARAMLLGDVVGRVISGEGNTLYNLTLLIERATLWRDAEVERGET